MNAHPHPHPLPFVPPPHSKSLERTHGTNSSSTHISRHLRNQCINTKYERKNKDPSIWRSSQQPLTCNLERPLEHVGITNILRIRVNQVFDPLSQLLVMRTPSHSTCKRVPHCMANDILLQAFKNNFVWTWTRLPKIASNGRSAWETQHHHTRWCILGEMMEGSRYHKVGVCYSDVCVIFLYVHFLYDMKLTICASLLTNPNILFISKVKINSCAH